jgi:hypothetical protein
LIVSKILRGKESNMNSWKKRNRTETRMSSRTMKSIVEEAMPEMSLSLVRIFNELLGPRCWQDDFLEVNTGT